MRITTALLVSFACILVTPLRAQDSVNLVRDGVATQISKKDLLEKFPATKSQKATIGATRADAIVGWYDKGNAYHEQKMEKNLGRNFDKLKLVENQVAVQKTSGVEVVDRAKLAKNPPDAVSQRVNPLKMRADAIVGWYDKGNAYHEQKMEKNLGKVFDKEKLLNQQALKGKALR